MGDAVAHLIDLVQCQNNNRVRNRMPPACAPGEAGHDIGHADTPEQLRYVARAWIAGTSCLVKEFFERISRPAKFGERYRCAKSKH